MFKAAGALVDRIKINALTRETRDGRPVWIKRRRAAAGPILTLANRFFDAVGNPVQALRDITGQSLPEDPTTWRNWHSKQ